MFQRLRWPKRPGWKSLCGLLLGLMIVIGSLPWLIATPPIRRWLLARANQALAPGGLRFDRFAPSWFGPAKIEGLVLIDPAGERVIDAPTATWECTLGQILFQRPRHGRLVLHAPAVAIDHQADGSIDILETLRPILARNPEFELAIDVERGSLKLSSPRVLEPIVADDFDLRLRIPRAPGLLSWEVGLSRTNPISNDRARLDINGHLDRWTRPADQPADLAIRVEGRDWPLSFSKESTDFRGVFVGTTRIERNAGLWSSQGRGELKAVEVTRVAWNPTPSQIDRLALGWDVMESSQGWSYPWMFAEIDSSFLKAKAEGDSTRGVELTGRLDLAYVREQFRGLPALDGLDWKGTARVAGSYVDNRDGSGIDLDLDLQNLELSGLADQPLGLESLAAKVRFEGGFGSARISNGWRLANLDLDGPDQPVAPDFSLELEVPRLVDSGETRLACRMEAKWAPDRLAIDRLRIESYRPGIDPIRVDLTGAIDRASGETALQQLGVETDSPISLGLGGIRLSAGDSEGPWRFEADLQGDAGSLDRSLASWLDCAVRGVEGSWAAALKVEADENRTSMSGRVDYDPKRRGTQESVADAVDPTVRGSWLVILDRERGVIDCPELVVLCEAGSLEARGTLSDLTGTHKLKLEGKLSPDVDRINRWLTERVDPGARLRAVPGRFWLEGPLTSQSGGDPVGDLVGEIGFELIEATVYGMKFGSTPVALRTEGGRLELSPISTTLNGGELHILSEIDLESEAGPILRLGQGSSVVDAEINENVSRRILAYVAPVLADATRVTGRVSAEIEAAELPLDGALGGRALLEGTVAFHDVEFTGGPLADELFAVVAPEKSARIRLNQPVLLSITDDRIHQRGLSVPLGTLTSVDVEGWVDFDRNMRLNASLPITPALVANNRLLAEVTSGVRLSLPIGGTLDRPEIDREELTSTLKETGATLLRQGAIQGAGALLDRLTRPRSPAAPRLTPEERKQRRQQAREARRLERQQKS